LVSHHWCQHEPCTCFEGKGKKATEVAAGWHGRDGCTNGKLRVMTEMKTQLKRPRPRPRLSLDIQHVDETHQRFPSSKQLTDGIVAPPISAVATDEPDRHDSRKAEKGASDNDDAVEEGDVTRPVSASNIVSDLAHKLVTLGPVGRGTSGAVNVGVHVDTGQLVAIKQISMLDNAHRVMLAHELDALRDQRSQLLHPISLPMSPRARSSSIVDYYGTYFSEDQTIANIVVE